MDKRLEKWQPTRTEVDEIVRELRPVICRLARRDQQAIAAEVLRRKRIRAMV